MSGKDVFVDQLINFKQVLIQILRFIKGFFSSTKQAIENEKSGENELCIIGNIVDKHFYGEHKELRRGTKHFRPNAKVFCLPEYGGMAHEMMVVLGTHRKSKRLIKIAISTKRIKNFRVKTVYKGCVINKCRTDAVILDLVESKKLSIAALRFIFLRKNQFKRTSLNRPLLFSCP